MCASCWFVYILQDDALCIQRQVVRKSVPSLVIRSWRFGFSSIWITLKYVPKNLASSNCLHVYVNMVRLTRNVSSYLKPVLKTGINVGVIENSCILKSDAASLDKCCPTFRRTVSTSFFVVLHGLWCLGDEGERFLRNDGKTSNHSKLHTRIPESFCVNHKHTHTHTHTHHIFRKIRFEYINSKFLNVATFVTVNMQS